MLKRTLLVLGLLLGLMLAFAAPASAGNGWGEVDCSQSPFPGCELGTGNEGDGRGDDGDGTRRQRDADDNDDNGSGRPGEGRPGDRVIGKSDDLAKCAYVRSDFQPPREAMRPAGFFVPSDDRSSSTPPAGYWKAAASTGQQAVKRSAAPPDEPGAWYVYRCSTPGLRDAMYRAPVWIPDSQAPDGQVVPSPEDLAQQAYNQLRLVSPEIKASPAGDQLVHLPTWLWLSRTSWTNVSATASVPGVSVTAVAKPTSVTWSMGDGGSVSCDGPGTPYSAKTDPRKTSPDCGYIYRTSSADQAGESFQVTATVHWSVSWSGAGQSGVFPGLTTSDSARFRVTETQALNTR